jgi:hypothetical protein
MSNRLVKEKFTFRFGNVHIECNQACQPHSQTAPTMIHLVVLVLPGAGVLLSRLYDYE